MHKNNFDFLRLLFALFVMISHSHIICRYSGSIDFLGTITNKQLYFSDLGMAGFFSISGYLIFQSLVRSKTLLDYYKKRVLRIYPGLFVALLITILIGFIVSNLAAKTYFTNYSTWSYFWMKLSLLYPLRNNIDGVLVNNPIPGLINGSLWTIPIEFCFYILLSFLFPIRNKKKYALSIVLAFYIMAIFFYFGVGGLIPESVYTYIKKPFPALLYNSFFGFGFYFCLGAILANFTDFLYRHKLTLLLASLIASIVLIKLNLFYVSRLFVLPIGILSFGVMATPGLSDLSKKFGDVSYGVYIYGFLIQQTLIYYFPFNYWQLILTSIPVALICGYVSWNLVEKRALRLKIVRSQEADKKAFVRLKAKSNNLPYFIPDFLNKIKNSD